MKVSEHADYEKSRAMSKQILDLIWSHTELSAGEALGACMIAINGILLNVPCPGCRKLHARSVKKTLPVFIRTALVDGAKYDASNAEPPSGHVH